VAIFVASDLLEQNPSQLWVRGQNTFIAHRMRSATKDKGVRL
jgi:hypothetical protein